MPSDCRHGPLRRTPSVAPVRSTPARRSTAAAPGVTTLARLSADSPRRRSLRRTYRRRAHQARSAQTGAARSRLGSTNHGDPVSHATARRPGAAVCGWLPRSVPSAPRRPRRADRARGRPADLRSRARALDRLGETARGGSSGCTTPRATPTPRSARCSAAPSSLSKSPARAPHATAVARTARACPE